MDDKYTTVSELEELVAGQQPEEPIDESSLRWSEAAYKTAIVVIDLLTGITIGLISYWQYGAVWFLAGAVSFFSHHKNWDAAHNNDKQVRNAAWGMGISVGAMILMAIVAAVVFILQIQSAYIEVGIVVPIIALFFWHAFQLAMYRFSSDKFKTDRTIAKARADADKQVRIIGAADTVLSAHEKASAKRREQYRKHGDQGAVNLSIKKAGGFVPTASYGKDVHGSELQEARPTQAPPKQ